MKKAICVSLFWAFFCVACSSPYEEVGEVVKKCDIKKLKTISRERIAGFKDHYGRNIAHISASKCEDPEVLVWLIENYPSLFDERSKNGRTVLSYAFGPKDFSKVKVLIDSGAKVNLGGSIRGEDLSVLSAAINLKSSLESIELIINEGVDVGKTEFYEALNLSTPEVVELILRRIDTEAVNRESSLGRLPLEIAIDRGMPELVSLLLDHGANPETPIQGFDSAEAYAISKGEVEIAEILRRR